MYPVSSRSALSHQSTKLIGKPSLVQILPKVNRLSQKIQVVEETLMKWKSYSMQIKESFSLSRNTDKRRDSSAITDFIIIYYYYIVNYSFNKFSCWNQYFVLFNEDLFLLFNIKLYISLHRFFRYLSIFKTSLIL